MYINKRVKNVTVYDFADGFFVEVSKTDDGTAFYLGHGDYGVTSLMFAIFEEIDESHLEKIICANVDTYIEGYKAKYFDI